MSAELVEEALKLPKYMDQIQQAEIQVPTREDPRTDIKQVAIVKTMRESHYEPQSKKGELPTVWSEQADQARSVSLIGTDPREFYRGMTSEEIDAWDKAAWEHEQKNNWSPEMSFEQYQKLRHKRLGGEITGAEYVEAGVTQPLKKGEEKEVREMQQKGELLKVIGEQDDRIKGLETSLAEIKDLLLAKI